MSPKGAEAPDVRGHAEEEREDRQDNFHYVRIRATEGAKQGDIWFPRIAVDANSVAVWLKLMRTCRYLGQHFFRRTEVLIVYIVGWFGCVFAFLWYLQLGTEVEALPQYVVALVMAALFIFWGGALSVHLREPRRGRQQRVPATDLGPGMAKAGGSAAHGCGGGSYGRAAPAGR